MSDEDFWEYARQRARTIPEPSSRAEYVECLPGDNVCLVALRGLAEVLPSPHRLARLPDVPEWMAGIMIWRGETIGVVDLRHYLYGIPGPDSLLVAEGILLIASHASQTLGLLVLSLGSTATLGCEQIAPPPDRSSFAPGREVRLIEGTSEGIPILNIPVLLAELIQQIGMTAYHG